MEHYAGIDVSLEQSSVCVVDGTGRIIREIKAPSEPRALVRFFGQLVVVVARIGLEAGPLSQWLYAGLTKAGFETVLLETPQVKAALSAPRQPHERLAPFGTPARGLDAADLEHVDAVAVRAGRRESPRIGSVPGVLSLVRGSPVRRARDAQPDLHAAGAGCLGCNGRRARVVRHPGP